MTTKTPKFKKGDRVKIIAGARAGKLGTVDEDYDDCPYIWVDGNTNWRVAEFQRDLEPINIEEKIESNYQIY